MRFRLAILTLATGSLAAGVTLAKDLPDFDAYLASPANRAAAPARAAAGPSAHVASVDRRAGVPNFLWAERDRGIARRRAPADPARAARSHLARHAAHYRMSAGALDSTEVDAVHDTGRGGIVVTFRQRVGGVEVFRQRTKVLMTRDHRLVAIAGHPHAAASATGARSGGFALSAKQAVARSLGDLYGARVAVRDTGRTRGGFAQLSLAPSSRGAGVSLPEPAHVKRVYYPLPGRLAPAYAVYLYARGGSSPATDAYAYVIAADDGRLLHRKNLTHADSFTYRVWAERGGDHRPMDGPQAEFSPTPSGQPDGSRPEFVAANLVTIEAFNTNPEGGSDPWLPADASETAGNNVDAYTDHSEPDGFNEGDIRAEVTGTRELDWVYDVSREPLADDEQMMGAVTQLFYTTNWLHDWYYDSGFDEEAGNAQANNFGRGGEEEDPLRAEAQDGALDGNRNNANMATPPDGISPRMQMFLWRSPGSGGPERDGSIDNTIVAHEWGHYLHGRLSPDCDSYQCRAMGEGWADFIALHLMLREDDDLDGAFPVAPYSTATNGENNHYFGIRRVPYSVDFDKNALTFKHIQRGEPLPERHPVRTLFFNDNAEAHNAGEVWATMMFEAYVALIRDDRHSFAEARRLMSDYVVAGMQLTPPSATFTEQRDAILAAVSARDEQDFVTIARAFARRGAGTGAESPPRAAEGESRPDLQGVEESFELAADLEFAGASVTDDVSTCDGDGVLDGGEAGTVTVRVFNPGAETLTGAEVVASSDAPGLSFPEATAPVPDVPPFEERAVAIEVALDESLTGFQNADIDFALSAPDAATTSAAAAITERVNFDDVPATSATDDVESDSPVWTEVSGGEAQVDLWAREVQGTNRVWRGTDADELADESLVSPDVQVSEDEPLVVEFRHRHEFETGPAEENGPDVFWDGAVIEISTDAGETWTDVAELADPGYGGTIGHEDAGNVLLDRQGYVSTNPSHPEFDTVTLDFGDALAGETVRLRFRVGTDEAAGAAGWEIDDIALSGIEGTPFPSIQAHAGDCGGKADTTGAPEAVGGCQTGAGSGWAGGLLLAGLLLGVRRRRIRTAVTR